MSKIFIIAGESSGDWLGAKLIRELKKARPNAEFYGIGGRKMEAEGFVSLFPMKEISLMGFSEILPHLPKVLKRIKQTEAEIRRIKPDVVVTIDSPGFNFRIAKKIQDMREHTKLVHYVAPTVWAYKPERAAKVAKLYDHMMVILPFEPPYFEAEGLATSFVGHPTIEDGLDKGDAAAFRERYKVPEEFICMMPGSRKGELKRNLPIFKDVAENMNRTIVILSADNAFEILKAHVKDWGVRVIVVDNTEKANVFAACKAGVIKSGTSGLEFAFANKPYVVAYCVSKITEYIVRKTVKVKFVNLLNILAGKELVKELLQENCNAQRITLALQDAIENADLSEYKMNLDRLKPASGTPSANAARVVLSYIEK